MADNKSQFDGSMPAGGTKAGGESNPFTADLKGDFNSNFGTNTNPVSQILTGGNHNGRRRKFILGGALVLVLGLFALNYFTSSDEASTDDDLAVEDSEDSEGSPVEGAENATDQPPVSNQDSATTKEVTKDVGTDSKREMTATTGPTLEVPNDGQMRAYDETGEPAVFKWSGSPGGTVSFSRSSTFSPMVRKVQVEGNSYEFRNPWPGKWYVQVENSAGKSAVASFTVEAPQRRNVAISSPADGQSVAGSGGMVSWTGDSSISRYKVEFSSGDWSQPAYKLQTVGTEAQLNGVPAGNYQMRVAAWSDVSGRWEYSNPVSVSVQ